jgi:protein ImuB
MHGSRSHISAVPSPGAVARAWPPEPERQALAAVAAWACQFTPRVSLEPPQALLLEVEGSLRYFRRPHGSFWGAGLRAGLSRLGFEHALPRTPAARAALWRSRGDGGRLEPNPSRSWALRRMHSNSSPAWS